VKITQERLKELLDYDPISGIFTRKKDGKIVGRLNENGYVIINVDGILFRSHRLAWLYVYGGIVPFPLDHIDGNKENNSINNLRSCTQSQNQANIPLSKNSTSGLKGVWYDKPKKKWKAGIKKDNKKYHLGYYLTKEEAHEAYCKAAVEFFGEFARFK